MDLALNLETMRLIRPKGAGGGGATAYRYHQIYVTAVGSGNFAAWSEIAIAESPGGADVTPTLSAITSNGHFGGLSTYQPGNLVDDNVTSIFHSVDRTGTGGITTVTIDYGAGNEKILGELKMTSRDDGSHEQTPVDFTGRGSQDNAAYTDVITVTGAAWPGTTAVTNTYTP
jgi:hypothetical protein